MSVCMLVRYFGTILRIGEITRIHQIGRISLMSVKNGSRNKAEKVEKTHIDILQNSIIDDLHLCKMDIIFTKGCESVIGFEA